MLIVRIGYFLVAIIKYPYKSTSRENEYSVRPQSLVGKKAWQQEQEAGWSHYIHSQVTESKKEVGPAKTSRSALKLKTGLLWPLPLEKIHLQMVPQLFERNLWLRNTKSHTLA